MYQQKHKKLLDCLQNFFGESVQVIGQKAGLHLLIDVKGGVPELIEKARQIGVKVYPTDTFWMPKTKNGSNFIMLGFGGLTENEIEMGIKKLSLAWSDNLDK